MIREVAPRPAAAVDHHDPVSASRGSLLVATFGRTSSRSYATALAIARAAARTWDIELGGTPHHGVAFARSPADASRALALVRTIRGWNSAHFFVNGRAVERAFQIEEVLRCYIDACACSNPSAHCLVITEELAGPARGGTSMTVDLGFLDGEPLRVTRPATERFAFPCAHLRPYFRLQNAHPASPVEQIEAAGIRRLCDLCPLFDPSGFRMLHRST